MTQKGACRDAVRVRQGRQQVGTGTECAGHLAAWLPLAEQLNVTVAELLQGRRVEEEQRFTREETEDLIRKALTFSAEPPERRQARTKKYLPVYVICCVLGAQKRWLSGRRDWPTSRERWLCSSSVWFSASSTGHMPCSGWPRPCPATTTRTASATLHRVPFHIHIPGIYYNNRNWKHGPAGVPGLVDGVAGVGAALRRRGQFSLSVPPAGRCGSRCWWCISPRCSGRS